MIGIGEQRLKKIFCCVIVAGIATVLIQITSQSISTDKITQAKKQEISLNQTELTGEYTDAYFYILAFLFLKTIYFLKNF